MPMAGLTDSDLMRNFRTVKDPYTQETWVAIPAIQPSWTIIHVHEADEFGNVRIRGAKYDDVLKAKAAKNVLVTCERLVPAGEFARHPELVDLPGFLVDAVVEVPHGAWPNGCDGDYSYDEEFITAYLTAAGTDEAYGRFLAEKVVAQ